MVVAIRQTRHFDYPRIQYFFQKCIDLEVFMKQVFTVRRSVTLWDEQEITVAGVDSEDAARQAFDQFLKDGYTRQAARKIRCIT